MDNGQGQGHFKIVASRYGAMKLKCTGRLSSNTITQLQLVLAVWTNPPPQSYPTIYFVQLTTSDILLCLYSIYAEN